MTFWFIGLSPEAQAKKEEEYRQFQESRKIQALEKLAREMEIANRAREAEKDEGKSVGQGRRTLRDDNPPQYLYRLAMAKWATEIRQNSPNMKWKEIAKRIGWKPDRVDANLKLLYNARMELERITEANDPIAVKVDEHLKLLRLEKERK